MATKEQERKALEQIEQILKTLGRDSYVVTAFEGCVDLAVFNIECDLQFSLKRKLDALTKKVDVLEATAKGAEAQRDSMIEEYNKKCDELAKTHEALEVTQRTLHETAHKVTELQTEIEMQQIAMRVNNDTINQLKAKLYDLIVE